MAIQVNLDTTAQEFTSKVNEDMQTGPFTRSKAQSLNFTLERNESEVTTFMHDVMKSGGNFLCQGGEWYREESTTNTTINKWFVGTHPMQLPEPNLGAQHFRLHSSDVRPSALFLQRNKRLQVIVQFTEFHLTPQNPIYTGGVWGIDGQLNEHIVSTALYCYGMDNITDSYLYFGAVVNGEFASSVSSSERNPRLSTLRTFGILPTEKNFQVIGRVRVHPDNAIFYPNIYKHRQGSFSLVDRSRRGYCKVLKLYLVDPAIPIISTSNVPPQQYDWWTKSKVHNQGLDIIQRLPPELKEIIHSYVDFPIDGKEQYKIQKDIRDHRSDIGDRLQFSPPVESDDEDEGEDDDEGEGVDEDEDEDEYEDFYDGLLDDNLEWEDINDD